MTVKADIRLRRLPERGSQDLQMARDIIDDARICHVGFTLMNNLTWFRWRWDATVTGIAARLCREPPDEKPGRRAALLRHHHPSRWPGAGPLLVQLIDELSFLDGFRTATLVSDEKKKSEAWISWLNTWRRGAWPNCVRQPAKSSMQQHC